MTTGKYGFDDDEMEDYYRSMGWGAPIKSSYYKGPIIPPAPKRVHTATAHEAKRQMLEDILTWKRPYDSDVEKMFVDYYLTDGEFEFAKFGPMENIVIVTDPKSKTLFSCHTDTVHFKGGMQEVKFDATDEVFFKDDNECLGADDGTGVWLMIQMIRAKVPGTYVFHRGEERGGIGSRWMRDNMATWLKQFDRAIAFDRRGETEVITHQGGVECCSKEFGQALCDALGTGWRPSPNGTFTDTKVYIGVIPECVNVSVGYDRQHSSSEEQSAWFADYLLDRVQEIEWEALPTKREPKEAQTSFRYQATTTNDTKEKEKEKENNSLMSLYDYKEEQLMGVPFSTLEKGVTRDPEWGAETILALAAKVEILKSIILERRKPNNVTSIRKGSKKS